MESGEIVRIGFFFGGFFFLQDKSMKKGPEKKIWWRT